ncbi:MAG: phosphatidylserine decarboxylase [Ignavibacterium sp.]
MFTKYGYTTIGIAAIISFILISISFFINSNLIKSVLIIIALIFLALTLNFFRDPKRTTPTKDNTIVAPADGKIILIKDIYDDKFINGKAKQVSIFMSIFNVHVNRIPISGKIAYLKYHKGEYLAAYDDKASEKNERMEIGIETKSGKVLFTQVAGFIARRIVCELKENQEVMIGNRFGMIKFGSRIDVIVPANWIVKVKKNDKVYAGESILFEY